ncbi:MAG: DUF4276 family protein [Cyanobacteria bacterium P01_H01_bin.150]
MGIAAFSLINQNSSNPYIIKNKHTKGQIEETFVRELLYEHFINQNIYLNPILVRTSKTAKGGVVSYAKIKPQVNRKCLEDATAFVTTMFDMYALPKDFPGSSSLAKINEPLQKAEYLEREMGKDIGHENTKTLFQTC